MPASAVQIANLALTKLGEHRILSLTDDSKQARCINALFDLWRDAELARHRWKFALTRQQLAADAASPDWGYDFAYTLPSELLSLVQVGEFYVPSGSKAKGPWQREGAKLLTDISAPLKIRFVQRVTNTGLFHPLFVVAFACRLAHEACEEITQSSAKKQALAAEYRDTVIEAVRADAMEATPDELPWGSWIDSREGASEDFD